MTWRGASAPQVEYAEAVLVPDVHGRLFRIGDDVRRVVEDAGQPAARRVLRPAGVAARRRTRPTASASGRRAPPRWPAARDRTASARGRSTRRTPAARRCRGRRRASLRGRVADLVEERPPARRGVRLGQVQGRHPEQPVGVDQLEQRLGVRVRDRPRGRRPRPCAPASPRSASLAASSVIFPRCPFSTVNSRYSSRVCPVSRSTPRPAPAASARHGAAGSTSPSTTGENGTPVRPAGPHRSRWSAGLTASEAAVSRAGSAAANASVAGGSPASAAMAAVTSAASAGEKNVPGTLCAIARRNRPPRPA